jgi:hypothetical protein
MSCNERLVVSTQAMPRMDVADDEDDGSDLGGGGDDDEAAGYIGDAGDKSELTCGNVGARR